MPEQDKIQLALKEIGFCEDLKVKVADGKVIAILKQRVFRPARHGVKTEIVIDEEIKI